MILSLPSSLSLSWKPKYLRKRLPRGTSELLEAWGDVLFYRRDSEQLEACGDSFSISVLSESFCFDNLDCFVFSFESPDVLR